MNKGFFISFEGGEGGGKSSQITLLAERLQQDGYEVVRTREPGGPPTAEAIRQILVGEATTSLSDLTELLLMNAARAENIDKIILPALAAGKIVLSDRFADSTRAYQGAAGGVTPDIVHAVEEMVVSTHWPDMTFILDLPVVQGFARVHKRGEANRFEDKDLSYHDAVRQEFLAIAAKEPERCVVMDATKPLDIISAEIYSMVSKKLTAKVGHG